MNPRVLAFGDDYGLPMLVARLPKGTVAGLVASSIRPQYFASLERLASRLAVPFLIQPTQRSSGYAAFVEQVQAIAPDFVMVHSYSLKLPDAVLACAPRGAVNVHSALLPSYRGANPIQWAIIAGERTTGVTVHYMVDRFDAGDIIAQASVPIEFDDTWRQVQSKLEPVTDTMLSEVLPLILSGRNSRIRQNEAAASTFARRVPADGRIEWGAAARDIYNLVRALVHPLPGAYCETEQGRLVLNEYLSVAEILALKFGAAGGQVLRSGRVCLRPAVAADIPRLVAAGLGPTSVRPGERNAWLGFVADRGEEHSAGYCVWSAIDWDRGAASLSVKWQVAPCDEDAADMAKLVEVVSGRELRLTTVRTDMARAAGDRAT